MLPIHRIQAEIKEIDAAFHCFKLKGSPEEFLELLADFEKKTARFIAVICLCID
jgi:hypothetical protein